jgi:hypothetical protein
VVAHTGQRRFSHAYWEILADGLVEERYWRELQEVRQAGHRDNERLLGEVLVPTLFSHGVSRRLFHGMVRLTCLRTWRHTVRQAARRSPGAIQPAVLAPYHRLAVGHSIDLLVHQRQARCVRELDPTGGRALARAGALRGRLQRGEWSQEAAAYTPGRLPAHATAGP